MPFYRIFACNLCEPPSPLCKKTNGFRKGLKLAKATVNEDAPEFAGVYTCEAREARKGHVSRDGI